MRRHLLGMWEPGFSRQEHFIEWRMWKQIVAAYDIDRWLMAGDPKPDRHGKYEAYHTMERALVTVTGPRCFLIPEHGTSIDQIRPEPDATIITGNAKENLKQYVRPGDEVLYIPTPKRVDLFAVTILPLVLHEF